MNVVQELSVMTSSKQNITKILTKHSIHYNKIQLLNYISGIQTSKDTMTD